LQFLNNVIINETKVLLPPSLAILFRPFRLLASKERYPSFYYEDVTVAKFENDEVGNIQFIIS